MSVALIQSTQAVCTLCQSEIRRDCMIKTDIRPRRNFITWPRQRVECICPNCLAVYCFTIRMEPGGGEQIEGGNPRPITNERQRAQIRSKFPNIPF